MADFENTINEKVKALAVHIAQKMAELKNQVDAVNAGDAESIAELSNQTEAIIAALGTLGMEKVGDTYELSGSEALSAAIADALITSPESYTQTYGPKTATTAYTDGNGVEVAVGDYIDADGNKVDSAAEAEEVLISENPDKTKTSYSAKAVDDLLAGQFASISEIDASVNGLKALLGIDDNIEDNEVTAAKIGEIAQTITEIQTALSTHVTDGEGNELTVIDILQQVASGTEAVATEETRAKAAEADLQAQIDEIKSVPVSDYVSLFDIAYTTDASTIHQGGTASDDINNEDVTATPAVGDNAGTITYAQPNVTLINKEMGNLAPTIQADGE